MKTVARKYHLFLCLSLSAGLSGQRISSPAVVVVALCESGHKSHKSLRSFTNKAPLQLRSTSETARQKDATDLFFQPPLRPPETQLPPWWILTPTAPWENWWWGYGSDSNRTLTNDSNSLIPLLVLVFAKILGVGRGERYKNSQKTVQSSKH